MVIKFLRNLSPLWKLFWVLVFLSIVSALILARNFYNEVLENKFQNLIHLNTLVKEGWVESELFSNESVMRILSERLLELDALQDPNRDKKLLNSALKNSPNLIGIGLSKPDGQLIFVSGQSGDNLLNILDENAVVATFNKALQSDHMVLGQTYYSKLFNKWILPLRYAVKDADGVQMVLILWYAPEEGGALFKHDNIPNDVVVSIINEDFFIIDYKVNYPRNFAFYQVPLPAEVVEQFDLKTIKEKEVTQKSYIDRLGLKRYIAVSYIPKYNLYVSLTRGHAMAIKGFKPIAVYITIGTFFFIVVLFLFFYFVSKKEKDEKKRLEYRANHDDMTGLLNYFALMDKLVKFFHNKEEFCLALIDLDNFNRVNDLYGHEMGDQIIKIVSERLTKLLKNDMYLARFSGDEFVLITLMSPGKSAALYKDILEVIRQPFDFEYNSIKISASIGAAVYPDNAATSKELMSYADIAQHQAKIHKDGFEFFDFSSYQKIQRKLTIEELFDTALKKREFYLNYQPQVDTVTRKIVGSEALVRWNNKEVGTVYPDEFIPIAEETGFIIPLGLFILEQACKDTLEVWEKCGKKFRLSVNVSVRQLIEDDFIKNINHVIEKVNFPCNMLVIEVTESIMIEDNEIIIEKLHQLRNHGISISLDDFGTGFSSLSMISKLPISELKIDQSFVKDILDSNNNAVLTEIIVDIGKHLKIKTVAEGVEAKEHAKIMEKFGCNILQGYHFLRPSSKEKLLKFIGYNG